MPTDSTLPDDQTPPESPIGDSIGAPPAQEPPEEPSDHEGESTVESAVLGSPAEEIASGTAPVSDAEPAAPKDALTELAARAEKGRLSPADETRAAQAIKDCLLDGRNGVALVLELLPKFAWM